MKAGDIFDTKFEAGCIVTVPPADYDSADEGGFLALDSEGVECVFAVDMIVPTPEQINAAWKDTR